jgi:hypothetical protein
LEDQVPWAVAFAYYPPVGIVFETEKLVHKQLWRQQKRALSINSQVNVNQAASLWRHGDEYRSRKRIFFVLQMTIFASQLALTGRIYDFWEEPNALRPILFNDQLKTWEAFAAVWRPIFDRLVDRFISIRNAYRIRELDLLQCLKAKNMGDFPINPIQAMMTPEANTLDANSATSSNTSSNPFWDSPITSSDSIRVRQHLFAIYTGDCPVPEDSSANVAAARPGYCALGLPLTTLYIREHGLNALNRDLAITFQRHPLFPSLIHLARTPTLSPVDSVIAGECHGLILDESNGYLPVAWSHHRFYDYEEEGGPVHWGRIASPSGPKLKALRNPDGILIFLFYYDGQWQVSTVATPDAKESNDQSNERLAVSDVFWQTWKQSGAILEQLDQGLCYSFWLVHPQARNRLLATEIQLVIEGALSWDTSGCVETSLEQLKAILPFDSLQDLNANNEIQTLEDAIKSVPLGGLILQAGDDRFTRLFVPCAYMKRLDTIVKLQGDDLLQEIEMVQFLVENFGNDSAWNYPLSASMPVFRMVSVPLRELEELLEKWRPKLAEMDIKEITDLTASLGHVGHFLFLMKSTKPPSPSARHFLMRADQNRMKKYIIRWWVKEFQQDAPARQSQQYSYK